MWYQIKEWARLLIALGHRSGRQFARQVPTLDRGFSFAARWSAAPSEAEHSPRRISPAPNDLEQYFDAHQAGHGIWKWRHYFDIYHRHLHKFRARPVNLCEIGVFSGGSLEMWRHYFGAECHVFGIDIEPACRAYQSDRTTILIGDQADRRFWREVRNTTPPFDIVIDDGGHHPTQQIVTLEEVLPHLRPGGVYVCEDIHGEFNAFAAYVRGLADAMNAFVRKQAPPEANGGGCCQTTSFQRQISSIHIYPFLTVIEKNDDDLPQLISPRHGTLWQPFL